MDPVGSEGDYAILPKADLILVTHEHGDHLDPETIRGLLKAGTQVVVSPSCAGKLKDAVVMMNGERRSFQGFEVEAVPAYNIVHKRPDGSPFHPKGQGNGYVLTIGGKRIYIAGDTEPVPEMAALKDIDIAFLPMNLPYTMSPEMTAEAARTIRPRILYPYHFGSTDTGRLDEASQRRTRDRGPRPPDVVTAASGQRFSGRTASSERFASMWCLMVFPLTM